MNNYEITKERIRPEFLKYTEEVMIRRFGLDYSEKYLYLDFCGGKIRMREVPEWWKKAGGDRDFRRGAVPGNYEEVLSIYDILCYSRPEASLSGRWCLVNSLREWDRTTAWGTMRCSGMSRRLTGIRRPSGKPAGNWGDGKCLWAIWDMRSRCFPFFPLRLRFYYGDEEFPAQLSVLFDENTLQYMHTRPLIMW